MNFEKDLYKVGIKVLDKVDKQTEYYIAHTIAASLSNKFEYLEYEKVFNNLNYMKMYIAQIPSNMSQVNYYYKESALYIGVNVDLSIIDEFILHECIHKLQEYRNISGKLIKLGLCSFLDLRPVGMAINEAGIQYVVAKTLEFQKQEVTLYNIRLETYSVDYFPLITVLMNQMVYITGEEPLIESVFTCKNKFMYKFMDACGESIYRIVQKNFDKILNIKSKILEKTNNSSGVIDKNLIDKELEELIIEIKEVFLYTQKLIMVSFFDNLLNESNTQEELNVFEKKLYEYKELLATVDGENFYNEYCSSKLNILFQKRKK